MEMRMAPSMMSSVGIVRRMLIYRQSCKFLSSVRTSYTLTLLLGNERITLIAFSVTGTFKFSCVS